MSRSLFFRITFLGMRVIYIITLSLELSYFNYNLIRMSFFSDFTEITLVILKNGQEKYVIILIIHTLPKSTEHCIQCLGNLQITGFSYIAGKNMFLYIYFSKAHLFSSWNETQEKSGIEVTLRLVVLNSWKVLLLYGYQPIAVAKMG